jgi:hypothetical protein
MYGSSIQQGTQGSTVRINFSSDDSDLRRIVDEIKNSMDNLQLSSAARGQLTADVGTVEAQMRSPHPKTSIITECLHSMRSIFEGMAGHALAMGLVAEITKLIGSS